MNRHCVPDWGAEDGIGSPLLPTANQMKSMATENELIELLWSNGHVVMHSQTNRRPPANNTEFKQPQKPEQPPKCWGSLGNSSNPTIEDETASWWQYSLGNSLDMEFYSELSSDIPKGDGSAADKFSKDSTTDRSIHIRAIPKQSSHSHKKAMLPPKPRIVSSSLCARSHGNDAIVKFPQLSQSSNADLGALSKNLGQNLTKDGVQIGTGEPSTMSFCGSNQILNPVLESHTFTNDAKGAFARSVNEDAKARSPHGVLTDTGDTNVTLSDGSGCGIERTGKKNSRNQTHKRKGRYSEDLESLSEEAEYEFLEAKRPSQHSASAGRSRAAEVHNLSERKRRDRINEKMKALQDLIPQCNKSDKASMLDEAIEYLKSLQLQVQMMWMGSGIAPMMFPGVQQYIPQMGMGLAHAPMPSIPSMPSPINFPRVPLVTQFMPSATTSNYTSMCPPAALNQVSFQPPVQNVHLPDPYARYLGFHHMQPSPQAMNLYSLGSHGMPQIQPSPDGAVNGKIQNDTCA